MPRVNYVQECRAFHGFAVNNRLTANEFMLWHALLEIFNKEARGNEWPGGYLNIANSVLLAHTCFGAGDSACDILRRARAGLARHGLIEVVKGRRNSLMPRYRMRYFSLVPEGEPGAGGLEAPGESGEGAGKMPPRARPSLAARDTAKPAPHLINPNENQNPNRGHTAPAYPAVNPQGPFRYFLKPPGHLEFDAAWKTSARARGAVAQRLLNRYGGEVNQPDAFDTLCLVMEKGLPPDAILRVMPEKPVFSQLAATLRALSHVLACGDGSLKRLMAFYGEGRAGRSP